VNLGQVMPTINEAVKEANELEKKELEERYNLFNEPGLELKQVVKEKTLPELEWLKEGDKIITRAAPCPTGVMHFGHARPYVLTDEYVRKYGGTYYMRFDDTDPKVKVPEKKMEQEFLTDFEWLGIKTDKVVRQSDNLKRYYKIIELLLAEGNAYICFCESEKWKQLAWKGKACPCRDKDVKEQLKHWKEMLKWKIKEGQAVVRIKTDLKHKDSSIRDWWIAKVVDDASKHPNTKMNKLHVWPSYNLASVVDDHDMKINFTIRGQEHIANEEKQKWVCKYLNWDHPHTMYHGKISKLGDMVLSKSKMKIIMEKEGILRYDDPRMATIKSFKRRGIRPETIRKLILACGIGISEVKIEMDMIAAFNKEFVGETKRYPFFEEGAGLEIYNVAKGEVDCCGEKILMDSPIETFIISKKGLANFNDGDIVRLKNGFNVKLKEVTEYGAKGDFVSYEKSDKPIVSWIKATADVEVLMSDGTKKIGLSTNTIMNAEGMIYLEGIGYANVEGKEENKINAVFAYE
jgi:glutamyl-tRNA synthetase